MQVGQETHKTAAVYTDWFLHRHKTFFWVSLQMSRWCVYIATIYEFSINEKGKNTPTVLTACYELWQTKQMIRRRVILPTYVSALKRGTGEIKFPVISWVELSFKILKLFSSVSKCLVRHLSSCAWWEEVLGEGRLIVTWGC